MSKQMKIFLGAFGAIVLAAVVLTMFGKPPNLPLGPLQGMLVKEEEAAVVDAANDPAMIDSGTDTGAANCDPTTGQPIDPATGQPDPNASPDACAAAGDPASGGLDGAAGADSATGTDTGAGATGTDPAAAAGAGIDPNTGAPIDAAAGTDPAAGVGAASGATSSTTPGAGAGAPAAGGNRATTDGSNNGNNPEALRAAKDATGVMQKAKITVSTTATLVPGTGGVGAAPAIKRYRSTVSAATLVMKLDQSAMEQWTGAGKKVRIDLVRSFLTRLGKSYRKATRSVTVLDASGTVLAIGDAKANAGVSASRVKLY